MSSWTDVTQAIASAASVVVGLIGFLLVVYQIRQLQRSIYGSTFESLYSQENNILHVFIDKPHLRPYFYDNKAVDPSDGNYNQVMAIAELCTDFFEHLSLAQENLPPETRFRWNRCIVDFYNSSPALRLHIQTYRDWYCDELLNLVSSISDAPDGITSKTKSNANNSIAPLPAQKSFIRNE
jgi:hypothetical protein